MIFCNFGENVLRRNMIFFTDRQEENKNDKKKLKKAAEVSHANVSIARDPVLAPQLYAPVRCDLDFPHVFTR